MSLLKRAGDLVYTFRFLKLLVTKFEDTEAFELGLIDKDGNRTKQPIKTSDEKSAYTPFHRLVFNIKKLLAVAPGGKSTLASYAAALYLLKENYGVSEKQLQESLNEAGIDTSINTNESRQWFVTESGLAPGSYKLRHNVVSCDCSVTALKNDYVYVGESTLPTGKMFGIDIFEAMHRKTGKPVYVTTEDLLI